MLNDHVIETDLYTKYYSDEHFEMYFNLLRDFTFQNNKDINQISNHINDLKRVSVEKYILFNFLICINDDASDQMKQRSLVFLHNCLRLSKTSDFSPAEKLWRDLDDKFKIIFKAFLRNSLIHKSEIYVNIASSLIFVIYRLEKKHCISDFVDHLNELSYNIFNSIHELIPLYSYAFFTSMKDFSIYHSKNLGISVKGSFCKESKFDFIINTYITFINQKNQSFRVVLSDSQYELCMKSLNKLINKFGEYMCYGLNDSFKNVVSDLFYSLIELLKEDSFTNVQMHFLTLKCISRLYYIVYDFDETLNTEIINIFDSSLSNINYMVHTLQLLIKLVTNEFQIKKSGFLWLNDKKYEWKLASNISKVSSCAPYKGFTFSLITNSSIVYKLFVALIKDISDDSDFNCYNNDSRRLQNNSGLLFVSIFDIFPHYIEIFFDNFFQITDSIEGIEFFDSSISFIDTVKQNIYNLSAGRLYGLSNLILATLLNQNKYVLFKEKYAQFVCEFAFVLIENSLICIKANSILILSYLVSLYYEKISDNQLYCLTIFHFSKIFSLSHVFLSYLYVDFLTTLFNVSTKTHKVIFLEKFLPLLTNFLLSNPYTKDLFDSIIDLLRKMFAYMKTLDLNTKMNPLLTSIFVQIRETILNILKSERKCDALSHYSSFVILIASLLTVIDLDTFKSNYNSFISMIMRISSDDFQLQILNIDVIEILVTGLDHELSQDEMREFFFSINYSQYIQYIVQQQNIQSIGKLLSVFASLLMKGMPSNREMIVNMIQIGIQVFQDEQNTLITEENRLMIIESNTKFLPYIYEHFDYDFSKTYSDIIFNFLNGLMNGMQAILDSHSKQYFKKLNAKILDNLAEYYKPYILDNDMDSAKIELKRIISGFFNNKLCKLELYDTDTIISFVKFINVILANRQFVKKCNIFLCSKYVLTIIDKSINDPHIDCHEMLLQLKENLTKI